jgi:hypothetical protein
VTRLLLGLALVLAGCPDGGNPRQLWIASDGDQGLILSDHQPDPF